MEKTAEIFDFLIYKYVKHFSDAYPDIFTNDTKIRDKYLRLRELLIRIFMYNNPIDRTKPVLLSVGGGQYHLVDDRFLNHVWDYIEENRVPLTPPQPPTLPKGVA